MPNWCSIIIHVDGPEDSISSFVEQGKHRKQELAITSFFPPPPHVIKEGGSAIYNWCVNNWGVKWGLIEPCLEERFEQSLMYTARTPWSAPIGAFEEISRLYPSLEFKIDYDEPGNALTGFARIHSGEIIAESES